MPPCILNAIDIISQIAQERLIKSFKIKDSKNLKELPENMPIDFDDSKTEDSKHLMTLVQDGFVTRYCPIRLTPTFTAQKLDGAILNYLRKKKVIL